MRILIVEDDEDIAEFVQNGLGEAGYAADIATNGDDGFRMALNEPYDVAIVDVMLPGRDGITLIEALRQRGEDLPVLILSAKREVDDRVQGFQSGGDDYLTKPFAFAELLERVRALLRRSGEDTKTHLRVGPLEMDLLARDVYRSGDPIDLQPREFSLLEYLMRNSDQVVSKTMILEHVWGFDFTPQTNVVEVLVHRLRSKVDDGYEPALIETVRGAGYVLRTP